MSKKITKTQYVVEWVLEKIHDETYTPRQRIPSIRKLAHTLKVSTFTIAQSYDILVSMGHIESSHGSGYYVCDRSSLPFNSETPSTPSLIDNVLDTGWLMSHLFSELPDDRAPGSGLLPNSWLLDSKIISNAIRKTSKEAGSFIYTYGHIQGYLPLREQFSYQLASFGININPNLIITMPGASSAIETIIRYITKPGDIVLVDDPSWFWLLGCLQQLGIKAIGVKREETGPNLKHLELLLKTHKPKLYITNSAFHNPTSFNISPSVMCRVLNLFEQYDSYILEDDVYKYFDSDTNNLRYATLDQSNRVFYISGVSKVLGGNWRVGFLCSPTQHIEGILRHKMLSNMTCTELTERSIYKIWLDANYKRHLVSIRERLFKKHTLLAAQLNEINIIYPAKTNPGLFIWIDTGVDTTKMAVVAHKDNWLLAPGFLFSPQNQYSSHLRLNVTRTNKDFLAWLEKYILSIQIT